MNNLNEHWDLEYTLCHPCHVKFDFVGKLEYIDEEAPYLLDRFRLSGNPGLTYHEHYGNFSDEARTHQFFKGVDLKLLLDLYHKYYWDFKIWGYSPEYAGRPEVDDRIV